MRHILIDANIYLRFYLLDQPLFQRVLPAVSGLENHIFVTSQVASEVRRNKVQVFLAHAASFLGQIPKTLNLPPIERSSTSTKVRDWKKKTKNLKKDIADCEADYKAWIKAEAKRIADASDPVSASLEKVFRHALQPTPMQISRAKQRKELGDPPGKRSDPLGDQITWEQFIDQCIKDQPVWIITKDRDFFDVLIDEIQLKPTLETDLRRRIGKTASIYIFDDPLAGLESYKAKSGEVVKNLPSKEEIEKIYQQQKDELLASLPRLPSIAPQTFVLGDRNLSRVTPMDSYVFSPPPTSVADFIVTSSLSNTAPTVLRTTEWACPSCGAQNNGGGILGSVCSRCYQPRP
jgi:hypothetical protein